MSSPRCAVARLMFKAGKSMRRSSSAETSKPFSRQASPTSEAWLLQRDVFAIPKASSPDHVRENRAALDLKLTRKDFIDLDEAFPPPQGKVPLEMK